MSTLKGAILTKEVTCPCGQTTPLIGRARPVILVYKRSELEHIMVACSARNCNQDVHYWATEAEMEEARQLGWREEVGRETPDVVAGFLAYRGYNLLPNQERQLEQFAADLEDLAPKDLVQQLKQPGKCRLPRRWLETVLRRNPD